MFEKVLSTLIAALIKLPVSDLRQLRRLLEQPGARDALIQQIDSILAFREAERSSRVSRLEKMTAQSVNEKAVRKTNSSHENAQYAIQHSDDLRASLAKLLENRSLFPSTRDVIEAINGSFESSFDYKTFRKRGRRDLIHKCWSHLMSFPLKTRLRMVKKFFDRYAQDRDGVDAYKDLFRILTRNE